MYFWPSLKVLRICSYPDVLSSSPCTLLVAAQVQGACAPWEAVSIWSKAIWNSLPGWQQRADNRAWNGFLQQAAQPPCPAFLKAVLSCCTWEAATWDWTQCLPEVKRILPVLLFTYLFAWPPAHCLVKERNQIIKNNNTESILVWLFLTTLLLPMPL